MINKRGLNILFLLAVFVLINAVYIAAKDGFFHRLAAQRMQSYLEREYGVKLFIGDVRGSLARNLCLDNVKVENIKGLPEALVVTVKEAEFRYGLKDLLRRSPRLELKGLELSYGELRLPVEFGKQGGLITLRLEEKTFELNRIWKIFSDANPIARLEGSAMIKAEVVLEDFKPKSWTAEIISDGLKIFYEDKMEADILLRLNLSGKGDSAKLAGNIFIEEARYYGQIAAFKLKQPSFSRFLPAWPWILLSGVIISG